MESKRPWTATAGRRHIEKKGRITKARLVPMTVAVAFRERLASQLAISNKMVDTINEM